MKQHKINALHFLLSKSLFIHFSEDLLLLLLLLTNKSIKNVAERRFLKIFLMMNVMGLFRFFTALHRRVAVFQL